MNKLKNETKMKKLKFKPCDLIVGKNDSHYCGEVGLVLEIVYEPEHELRKGFRHLYCIYWIKENDQFTPTKVSRLCSGFIEKHYQKTKERK